jgi:thiol-disulfide isomerase/thioredoxin
MKNLKLLLLLVFYCFLFKAQSADLQIKVIPYKDLKENEFTVCIEKATRQSGFYEAFDTMYVSKVGKFEIKNLDKGRYVLAIMHPSSDILLYDLLVPEKESVIDMNVELDRITIPEKVDSVRVTGDFNGWDWQNCVKMQYDTNKKYWYVPDNDLEKVTGEYYFLVNFNDKKHTFDLPVAKKRDPYADYHNVGNKKIIFIPQNFKQGIANPKVTITGADPQYSIIHNKLKSTTEELRTNFFTTKDIGEIDKYQILYSKAEETINTLKDQNKDKYGWMFPDYQLTLYNYSPINLKINLTRNTPDGEKYFNSDDYFKNIKDKALLLKGLEINDMELNLELINEINNYTSFYMANYDLYNELNIPYGYFENFLADVLKESENPEICGSILNNKAQKLIRSRPEKAKDIFNEIKAKYPAYSGVKNGSVDRALKAFSVVSGAQAPDFKVATIDGKEIELSSLRGKYVFLDFWGSWCGPCKAEIPNIKKMYEKISGEELVIIGLICHDQTDKVLKYIKDNEIKYSNAVASDKLMSDFGVRYFPTTFLIGKDGQIISKDLRGEDLAAQVSKLME